MNLTIYVTDEIGLEVKGRVKKGLSLSKIVSEALTAYLELDKTGRKSKIDFDNVLKFNDIPSSKYIRTLIKDELSKSKGQFKDE